MVPFKYIPSNLRVPLFYAEVDNSQANTATQPLRALIIGQGTTAGLANANVPRICQGVADAQKQFGASSMLAGMVAAYRKVDQFGELWCLPLADDPAATAAAGTVTFAHAAVENGTLYMYVGNTRYTVPILSTATNTDNAAALAAVVNADPTAPVAATVASNVVTFTAVNKGAAGNSLGLRVNYLGPRAGEVSPAGLNITLSQPASGATNPDMTAGLTALGDRAFDVIICPYNDTTSLNTLAAFLNDTTGRWSFAQQIYGHVFYAKGGTLGQLVTFGNNRNNQHETCFGYYNSPAPEYLWAAGMAAAEASSRRVDPALPTQTVTVPGLVPPNLQSRFVMADRNTLLYNGISTFTIDDGGTIRIENTITTYQTNAFGSADNSYLEVDTIFTAVAVLRALRTAVTSKYSRVKLAPNGTRVPPGAAVVTPGMVKAELIAQYRQLEAQGLVVSADAFKAGLIVEQDTGNPNRLNVLYDPVLISQLRIFAVLFQFRLIASA
jgi:phage tail sheath gpL-like